ncbi:MAG: nucleotidyltransferase substrate binding protein [Deltaproteobacteria bacterium]|nr:nucleotidyltransferase substrate binding protein [Deltaproteobacteria bacterium]
MDMITDRNRTSHLYDDSVAAAVANRIAGTYRPRFSWLVDALRARAVAEDV